MSVHFLSFCNSVLTWSTLNLCWSIKLTLSGTNMIIKHLTNKFPVYLFSVTLNIFWEMFFFEPLLCFHAKFVWGHQKTLTELIDSQLYRFVPKFQFSCVYSLLYVAQYKVTTGIHAN